MALAEIQRKIEEDAAAEAEALLARAREQAERIRRKATEEVEHLRLDAEKKASSEEKEIFRRREVVRRVDEAKLLLNAKRRLLDHAFREAVSILNALPDAEYAAFAERLVGEGGSGEEALVLGRDESRLNASWLERLNQRGKTGYFFASEREPFTGGLQLQSGRIRVDASFESLVEQARETLEGDVVKRLFSR